MIIQFCGLSGAGKTTIARGAKQKLRGQGVPIEIIDGDEYRAFICRDLGFSRADRMENIRRLAFIAHTFSGHDITAIICAINPYEEVREEVRRRYPDVKTVFIRCGVDELIRRDPKGLYKKALLPEGHKDRISNLTGVNDPFEVPASPDLVIDTETLSQEQSIDKLVGFILENLK